MVAIATLPTSPIPIPKVTAADVDRTVGRQLARHLRAWLGAWPPAASVEVLIWQGRDRPGWDGGTWLGLGVEGPVGTVLSLSPRLAEGTSPPELAARARAAAREASLVPPVVGPDHQGPDLRFGRAAFRWSARPASLPDAGEWVDRHDPRLPAWLRPFNGGVLVAWDEHGRYAAGVGIKTHTRFGRELAVATEPGHRGRGLARALVAQAARRVIAEGAVPLYLHEPGNVASARVAEAAGFPDRGWRVLAMAANAN